MDKQPLQSLLPIIQEAADPYRALSETLSVRSDELEIFGERHKLGRVKVISIGKAAYPMAKWAMHSLRPIKCITVVPKGVNISLEGATILQGAHPIPDESSLKAGEEVMREVSEDDYDTLIVMLSGGASAMVEVPLLHLEELINVNKKLVTSGLSIREINAVRKHLSLIKGGRLGKLSKGKIINFIVSDVPGNDIASIGSGPTVPDPTTFNEALEIALKIGLDEKVIQVLRRGVAGEIEETPKSLNSKSYIVLDNMKVLRRTAKEFKNSLILTSELQGSVNEVAKVMASIFKSCTRYGLPLSRPFILFFGGEPEVEVKGRGGVGGRNSEMALHLLKLLKDEEFGLLAYATDGIDGNSPYAGAIVTDSIKINEIESYLAAHDTYTPLARLGATIKTGYTHTNVNNIYALMG
jgi:glycerate 2-kinase